MTYIFSDVVLRESLKVINLLRAYSPTHKYNAHSSLDFTSLRLRKIKLIIYFAVLWKNAQLALITSSWITFDILWYQSKWKSLKDE